MLLPTTDQRTNRGTWLVPTTHLPGVAAAMASALPLEAYDPAFQGQELETTYFDTARFALAKARQRAGRYLTLRLRRYLGFDTAALSAKTEDGKYRLAIDSQRADFLLHGGINAALLELLPTALADRLLEWSDGAPLLPVVAVCFRRYAVEDDVDRLTLDVGTHTDTGRCMPAQILELKSTVAGRGLPARVAALGLRPTRMSKFLWATR